MLLALTGCTQGDKTTKLLKMEGYSNIEITGYDWFSCSKDDTYHTGFKAEKNGKTVEGVVCAGMFFKGSTIRYK